MVGRCAGVEVETVAREGPTPVDRVWVPKTRFAFLERPQHGRARIDAQHVVVDLTRHWLMIFHKMSIVKSVGGDGELRCIVHRQNSGAERQPSKWSCGAKC